MQIVDPVEGGFVTKTWDRPQKHQFLRFKVFTLPGTNMEVEDTLFVEERGLPRDNFPLPC